MGLAPPILHDTVTLRHFAAAEAIALLAKTHSHRPEPRWTSEIRDEVSRAAKRGISHCSTILAQQWLGTPAEPTVADLKTISALQIGLNEGSAPAGNDRKHLGEAECICFAEKTGGLFATDDNGAFEYAVHRPNLGPGRVIDTVDILRSAVAIGEVPAEEAARIAGAVESAGRDLRRCHRNKTEPSYFQL